MKKNVLGVIKADMDEIYFRLNTHQEDYMRVFSSERTRKHFDEIFFSRYYSITGSDLALVPASFLGVVSKFYHEVKNLFLYLKMTEDMPSAVMNKLSSELKTINQAYEEFNHLFITYSDNKDSNEESSEKEPESKELSVDPNDVNDPALEENLFWDNKGEDSFLHGEAPTEKLSIEELDEKGDGQNFDGPPPFDKE